MQHWICRDILLLMVVSKLIVTALGLVTKLRPRGVLVATRRQHQHLALGYSTKSNPPENEKDDTIPPTSQYHTITWEVPHNSDGGSVIDSSSNNSQGDIVWQARHGELLRTAALRVGKTSPHNGRANLINCRGLGTCGTCAVELFVDGDGDDNDNQVSSSSSSWLAPPNIVERTRLSVPPGHGQSSSRAKLRLACQVVVKGNLRVRKYAGFWGQHCCGEKNDGGTVVRPTVPTVPFGQAEYLLDRTSPAIASTVEHVDQRNGKK